MARKPKAKRKPQPPPQRRPSGLVVVLAFAIAIGAAVSLIVLAVALRTTENDAAPPTTTPVVDLDGIPQEGRVLGSPDAEVTLIEYADLQCPACRAYTESYFPEIVNRYVRPGRVRTEFRGLAFLGPDSETALRWVLAAGLQNRLWQLQEALYRNQGGENSGWVTEELLRRLAGAIPGLDADQILADADGDAVDAQVAEGASQAEADEIRGTPGLVIQVGDGQPTTLEPGIGISELTAALDDALGS
jgi:protein-disulfide isomerase